VTLRRKSERHSGETERIWGVGLTDKSTVFYTVYHAGSIPARPAISNQFASIFALTINR
jgi:hypothetical protein